MGQKIIALSSYSCLTAIQSSGINGLLRFFSCTLYHKYMALSCCMRPTSFGILKQKYLCYLQTISLYLLIILNDIWGYFTIVNFHLLQNLLTIITLASSNKMMQFVLCVSLKLQYCVCLVQMWPVLATDGSKRYCIFWLQLCNNCAN